MSIVSVPGTSAELRYSPVEKPSNSVVPDRFYQSSVDINLKSIDIIAQPHLHNDLDMLVIVRSSPEHFQRRDAIRMTWGNVSEYRQTGSGYSIGIVYLVGKSPDKSINKLLLSESNQHADLLYADYLESYSNLTVKDILAFQYSMELASKAVYLAIAGDEIVTDLSGVLDLLTSKAAMMTKTADMRREVVFCYEFPCCTDVIRDKSSKYLVQNDYAYENDDVHSKIIQLWFAMKSQQGRQKLNSELYMLPQFLVVVVMSVVVLGLCFRRLSQPMYRYFLRSMAS
ncbi:B3GNT5 [Bugula neritina]|uniref:Hexosyltransferase n=1 Tax=Bugula neritina TaxID=10212 RepID=A0A7J7KPS5_BUGNE|nr:B3GNT5 [Bugula neritina]